MQARCVRSLFIVFLVLVSLTSCSGSLFAGSTSLSSDDKYFGVFTPKQFYLGSLGLFAAATAFDKGIRDDFFKQRNSKSTNELRRYGDVGEKSGLILGSAFGLQGMFFQNAASRQTSALLLKSFFVSGLSVSGIKYMVGRSRPEGANSSGDLWNHERDSSFPSGHTTVSFSAATVIAEQYPRWYVAVPAYMLASGVGLSRMKANKHWASDVIAGAFLGTFIAHSFRQSDLHRSKKNMSWHVAASVDRVELIGEF